MRFLSTSLVTLFFSLSAHASDALVVYASARTQPMAEPLLKAFTEKTHIETEFHYLDTPELFERLEKEGDESPVDVVLITDSDHIVAATKKGIFQPVQSDPLKKNIPEGFRDADNRWYGLAKRARVIIYNKAMLDPATLSTYEDLADPKWKGKILVRSSDYAYNQLLISEMIAKHGKEKAAAWVKGVGENLVRKPEGGDKDQIKAVAKGIAPIAIANSYYYARYLESEVPLEKETAAKTAVFHPNQQGGEGLSGVHMDISGGGVAAGADKVKEAVAFLEFVSGEEGQKIYASSNHEYPVNPAVEPMKVVKGLGDFKADSTAPAELEQYKQDALAISKQSSW